MKLRSSCSHALLGLTLATLLSVSATALAQYTDISASGNITVGGNITINPTAASTDLGAVFKGYSTSGDLASPAGPIPASGPGVRMMWYPGKAAFRVGGVTSPGGYNFGAWDDVNIGTYSFAAGYNAKAVGSTSVALGSNVTAASNGSIALGTGATAGSSNLGPSIAIGSAAVASGYSDTTAIGFGTQASGYLGATAIGYSTHANAKGAMGFGHETWATGEGAMAANGFTIASGKYATSLGYSTTAQSYGSTVVGRFNIVEGSPTDWVSTDPVFVVGTGDSTTRKNALTIYKNGNAVLNYQTLTAGPKSILNQELADARYLQVTTGGNVGIGTPSPQRTLEISAPAGADSYLRIDSNSTRQAALEFSRGGVSKWITTSIITMEMI